MREVSDQFQPLFLCPAKLWCIFTINLVVPHIALLLGINPSNDIAVITCIKKNIRNFFSLNLPAITLQDKVSKRIKIPNPHFTITTACIETGPLTMLYPWF